MKLDIHPDIRHAWTPPAAFYRSPEAFQAVRERVFLPSWQFVGDTEPLKAPGAVVPFTLLEDLLDEPLMLIRGDDDRLRCLSNVCTHRGNLVVEGPGVERVLRCRYHGRRFGLDGRFQHMPEFEGCAGFPAPTDNLPSIPLENWGPWLFASLQPAVAFQEWFAPVIERVGWLPLHEFRHAPERRRDYLIKGHWALYVDNYLEGFHIPYIHSGLNDVLDYGSYATLALPHGVLQIGISKGDDAVFELPANSPEAGQKVSAYYFWLFPNLMLNFYPWGLSVNVVRPLAPGLTKVSFIGYVWRPDLQTVGAGAELDRVEREDEAVVELVQKGIRSRLYDRGRYSPTRETGTHWFHRLLDQSMS